MTGFANCGRMAILLTHFKNGPEGMRWKKGWPVWVLQGKIMLDPCQICSDHAVGQFKLKVAEGNKSK